MALRTAVKSDETLSESGNGIDRRESSAAGIEPGSRRATSGVVPEQGSDLLRNDDDTSASLARTGVVPALCLVACFILWACRQPSGQAPGDAGALAHRSGAALVPAPVSGAAEAVVRDAVARAGADGRRVVVYAGATWCEPCQAFHHALESGEVASRFPDIDFLAFDVDRDRDRLLAAGYRWTLIPMFALPNADGRFSGEAVVQGGVRGEPSVPSISGRLDKMLAP
jgi:thiol-disulfide isomerase/thioredoxin